VANSATQHLAGGEQVTETFTVSVRDPLGPIVVSSYVYDGTGAGSQPQPNGGGDAGNLKLTDGTLATGGWNDGTHVGFRDDSPDDGGSQPQVTFDLGSLFDVSLIDVYSNTDFAALDSVLVSASSDGSTFTTPTAFGLTFSSVSGKLTKATIDVSAFPDATHYRLDFRQDTQWAFISEVDFFGGPVTTVIPEPCTLAIWSLGLLGLALCGRRRRTK
jgi:hypothetical protein